MLRIQGLRIMSTVSRVFPVVVVLLVTISVFLHLGVMERPTFTRKIVLTPTTHYRNSTTSSKLGDSSLIQAAPPYVEAIMKPEDTTFDRLECPPLNTTRYDYLRDPYRGKTRFNIFASPPRRKYFFALNLHENLPVLPRLVGTIIEAIRFLGPEQSALSIVEGRSEDGTYEILEMLREPLANEDIPYYFSSSDKNPEETDRIQMLADVRNEALEPLIENPDEWSSDATVIFLNDVALCMEDILELIHQRIHQNADMTCAMDWMDLGRETFYDVWVARDIKGDTFFEIDEGGSWDAAWNLFWNNEQTLERFNDVKPFQVYACWNGGTAFTAKPLLEKKIKFRRSVEGECFMGEPTIFCKELWQLGYGRIAVIPSVNLEYSDHTSRRIKEEKGRVSKLVENMENDKIDWDPNPPEKVKCAPDWDAQTWLPWNESSELKG